MVSKDLVAASAKPLILSLLTEGDSYGYKIIQRVKELSGGKMNWKDGMLYPVLHRLEDQEMAALSLHLLQVSLVYVNTLMLQQVLGDASWRSRMTDRDMAALTPLVHAHVNPYGIFELDMSRRLPLDQLALAA